MARAPVSHIHPASSARGAAHRLTPVARGGAAVAAADFVIEPALVAWSDRHGLLLAGAAMWRKDDTPALDFLRGAAVVYMTVTGVVFTLLLRGTDVDTTIPWVNTVVHEAGPLFILADWFVLPPRLRISAASQRHRDFAPPRQAADTRSVQLTQGRRGPARAPCRSPRRER